MDLIIDELVIEEDRPEHIAKHKVVVKEVLEVVNGDYIFIDGKLGRWLLIGKTKRKRFKEERSFYKEFALLRAE